MANIDILSMPVAVPLGASDYIPVVQSGTNKRATAQAVANTFANNLPAAVEYVINDGGTVISAGNKGYLQMPFAGTFTSIALLGDQTGSVSIDLWLCSYSAFSPPSTPSASNSIVAGNYPTISSGTKYQNTDLSSWSTVGFSATDILAFDVRSNTSFTQITISIKCLRTVT